MLLRGLAALRTPRTDLGVSSATRTIAMTIKRKASTSPAAAAGEGAAKPAPDEATPASASKRVTRTSPAKTAAVAAAAKEAVGDAGTGKASAPAAKKRASSAAAAAAAVRPRPVFHAGMRPPPLTEGRPFKVLSWNVAGLRALLRKDPQAICQLVEQEGADVLCLQEHKLQDSHLCEVGKQLNLPPSWHCEWNCSTAKKGYSGVAVCSRTKPLSVTKAMDIADHDGEGRLIAAEFDWGFVVNVYVPNSGDGLKRLEYRTKSWDPALAAFLKKLEQRKPVVLTGDLNCAPQPIDIHDPKRNLRSAGFTQEERDSFAALLAPGGGFVDTFRRQYPDVTAYTYWSWRSKAKAVNRGWRLDHFLASQSLVEGGRVYETYTLPDVELSDHCPLGLVLQLE